MRLTQLLEEARKTALAENSQQVINRIEAIPGWEKLNFLMSLRQQMRAGRTASPKQLAVLDDIEQKVKARAGATSAPSADPNFKNAVQLQIPRGGNLNSIMVQFRKSMIQEGKPIAILDLSGTIMQRGGANKLQALLLSDMIEYLYDWIVGPDEDEADYGRPAENDEELLADWSAWPTFKYIEDRLQFTVKAGSDGRSFLVWANPALPALLKTARGEGEKKARVNMAKAKVGQAPQRR